ncbi:hypothetical protein Klosneuvirus_3_276 [Klosneuvirus KNV1]|uniref:Uncharacterized protein n=1 Tax=Klosneuvirus KNV1 TaxID=1977640 RepID=A0A1V0SKE7_9VIRU|nr:hypothetical protein Klosneuvirus_3_276 [Klosneuvirus KNV1]
MSCDYYIIVNLLVTYEQNCQTKIEYFEFERMRMYYIHVNEKDDNYDTLVKEEMKYMTNTYKKLDKTLYMNHSWIIKDQKMIDEYIECLKRNNINLDNVIRIEKKHYCQTLL